MMRMRAPWSLFAYMVWSGIRAGGDCVELGFWEESRRWLVVGGDKKVGRLGMLSAVQ
jgi:hypothetical protein